MTTTEIRTPSGRDMTADQYIDLVSRLRVEWPKRDPWLCGGASHCTLGHDVCAAWAGGPCSAEVEDSLEDSRRATKEGERQ